MEVRTFPALSRSVLSHAKILGVVNGEQDQGIPFKGPNPLETESSAVDKTPELEQSEFPKSTIASALRRDSFKDIGQRRRSSASNQPSVNLRRGTSHVSGVDLIRSSRVFQGQ